MNSLGKRTVDAATQLDDTSRFVFELVGQAVRNAGYADMVQVQGGGTAVNYFTRCASPSTEPCPVLGFDNSRVTTSQTNYGSVNSGAPNGSDSLAVRFYGANIGGRRDTNPDGSFVTCNGRFVGRPMTNAAGELGLSTFWVRQVTGDEPELMCTDDAGDGTGRAGSVQPIARGVESFQVMYGVDLCLPAGLPACTRDSIPDRWVSASSMAADDWPFVRAVRVGLVLRAATRSSQAPPTEPLYPLGKDFTTGVSEAPLTFTPPNDGRMRRSYTSTFMLRNRV